MEFLKIGAGEGNRTLVSFPQVTSTEQTNIAGNINKIGERPVTRSVRDERTCSTGTSSGCVGRGWKSDDFGKIPDDWLTIRPGATVGKSDDYWVGSDDYLTIDYAVLVIRM